MYNWAVLLYTRDWYKIVNQLYFNKKKFKKPKKKYNPIEKLAEDLLDISTNKTYRWPIDTWKIAQH